LLYCHIPILKPRDKVLFFAEAEALVAPLSPFFRPGKAHLARVTRYGDPPRGAGSSLWQGPRQPGGPLLGPRALGPFSALRPSAGRGVFPPLATVPVGPPTVPRTGPAPAPPLCGRGARGFPCATGYRPSLLCPSQWVTFISPSEGRPGGRDFGEGPTRGTEKGHICFSHFRALSGPARFRGPK